MKLMTGGRLILAADNDPVEILAARRSREIERVRRGIYMRAPRGADRFERAEARALAHIHAVHEQLTTAHWFSHDSAALLWGFPTLAVPDRAHVTQTTNVTSPRARDLVRHTTHLPEDDRTRRDGLPLTTRLRTAADCAMSMRELEALVVLDGALRLGVSRAELEAHLARLSGMRGVRRARSAVALADARAESPGETVTRYRLLEAGFAPPELQVEVHTRTVTRRLDLGWPELMLGLEYDGSVKYTRLAGGDPSAVVIVEKRRQEEIEEAGWIVARIGSDDVRTAATLTRFLAPYLERARRRRARG